MDQPLLFHRCFNDVEDFCDNARNWNLEYRQIESGSFTSELLMFGNDTTLLTRAMIGRKMIQRGAPPEKLITFGLLADPGINIHWRNLDISGDHLFVFPENGELDCISYNDFDVFVISLTETKLNDSCQSSKLPDIRALIGNDEAFRCESSKLAELRAWLLSAGKQLTLMASRGPGRVYMQHFEQELADRLIGIFGERHRAVRKKSLRRRDVALVKVRDYMANADTSILSVPELCKIAGVSERTLEYAFRERYGMTPINYLLFYRLNEARKQLRLADSRSCHVTEIARQHGFWHMGAFGADYKKLFAELPSKTLHEPPLS